MADKNLPIKLFGKRKGDERRTEGGGDASSVPGWVLPMDELRERAISFAPVMAATIEHFDDRPRDFSFLPTTLKVEIDDAAIAKTHRPDIKKVFNVNNKTNFIGFTSTNTLLVKVDNKEDARAIQKNVQNYELHRKALSAVVSIDILEPEIRIPADHEGDVMKVTFLNYRDFELNRAVAQAFSKFCSGLGINYVQRRYAPELTIFRLNSVTPAVVDRLKSFDAIELITFMPKYEVSCDTTDETLPIKQKTPTEGVKYPVVGVLDSGIAPNSYLKPWIIGKSSPYPDPLINQQHGTGVASVLLYGDELQGAPYTGLEGCMLYDATVYPDDRKETIYEDDLVENIREAIVANKDKIKIWNLSLGTRKEADNADFSDFAVALDSIQEANNVLICKSVGNCDNFRHGYPRSRISVSADSLRSLVVGSIAHMKGVNDISDVDHPSPFTRIGYGPGNVIKPELVSYGGNAGLNALGKMTQTGVRALDIGGNVTSIIGTSFSTPRITALVSALDSKLKETFNPLLLKALAIHSAKYPASLKLPIAERVKQMGFGVPSHVNDILFNDPHEITLILQDTLVKGEFMEILEFPFPERMIDSETGCYYGEIKLTLVTSPVLREKQGAEYCQSNVDVFFGTYDKLKERDISKPNILNAIGPDGNKNLLRDANYQRQFKKDVDSAFARERMLINYHKKYQPIKKWVVNLDEVTPATAEDFLKAPKKWYLKLSGLYRDYCEMMALVDAEELSQELCLILTIRDPRKQVRVYDDVTQLLGLRNFSHSNIQLRQDIRVNG
jgi:hypothetical protein